MKIPLLSKTTPKHAKALSPPPEFPPYLPGSAKRFFIPELLEIVDADRDGIGDSLRIGITNIWMSQRLTGVALSIDGLAVKGLNLRIDNGFAIFRADDIRRVRFEPGADFTLTAEGVLPAEGQHRIDLVLSGTVAEIAVRGIEIIVKEDRAKYAFIDSDRCEKEALSNKPRLHLIPYTSFSSEHLRDAKDAVRVEAGNIMEAIHLCNKHDAFAFTSGGLASLRYLRSHDPGAFTALKALVKNGRMELVFTEPGDADWAYAGGESIIRQLMRWQRFCLENLGVNSEMAWWMGAGGFPAQLPQILRKCGFNGLIMNRRLSETEGTSLIWKAPDGGSIVVYTPGVGYHEAYPIPDDAQRANNRFELIVSRIDGPTEGDAACIPCGTALGCPQERVLFFVEQWNQKYPFLSLEISTFGRFLNSIIGRSMDEHRGIVPDETGEFPPACSALSRAAKNVETSLLELETIRLFDDSGEEFSPSCNESMKLWELLQSAQSRHMENELLSSAKDPKLVCLDKVEINAKEMKREILLRLASKVTVRPDERTILVANTLGFPRRETIEIDLPGADGKLPVIHDRGNIIPTQILQSELYADGAIKRARLQALVDAPACGYRAYYVASQSDGLNEPQEYFFPNAANDKIENGFYKFTLDPKTGSIISAWDRKRDWTYQFRRGGLLWSANDKDSFGTVKFPDAKVSFQADSCEILENGPVRAAVKYYGRLCGKDASVTYRLSAGSRRLDVLTEIKGAIPGDGLCVDFDIKLSNPQFYSDAPFEILEGQSDYSPVATFCELAAADRGVAFLHDGIPDWRVVGKGVRATLWSKAASSHGGISDSGATVSHCFSYAIYIHAGSFEKSGAVKRGAAFTRPLSVVGPVSGEQCDGELPQMKSLLRIEPADIMMSSFFIDEKGRSVFRLWETGGKLCEARIIPGRSVHSIAVTDCLGREAKFYTPESGVVSIPIRPHEIKTCRLVYDQ